MRNIFAATIMLAVVVAVIAVALTAHALPSRNTPPLGWNSWNLYACNVNATLLKATGDALVKSGLSKYYSFVQSDDCWNTKERAADGGLIPDPARFPDGFAPVCAYLKKIGLGCGIYTAKGPFSCQKRAASCMHEAIIAKQFVEYGVNSEVKDDSCSFCPRGLPDGTTDDLDYKAMFEGLQAAARAAGLRESVWLTTESQPIDSVISKGGYGNAKRVGHDISPYLQSMISLVDLGSNNFVFVHNNSNSADGRHQSWAQSFDMSEIGVPSSHDATTGKPTGDFVCASSIENMRNCRTHFAFWTILKSVFKLGNDIMALDPATLKLLSNKIAIEDIHQDPLVHQARRVSVAMPRNTTLLPGRNFAVIKKCDAARPTQRWKWRPMPDPSSNPKQMYTFLEKCSDKPDLRQQWIFDKQTKQLINKAFGTCVDPAVSASPLSLEKCAPGGGSSPEQTWIYENSTGLRGAGGDHIRNPFSGMCLDAWEFSGPQVQQYKCKPVGGDNDRNQRWIYDEDDLTLSVVSAKGMCLTAAHNDVAGGGLLTTTDPATGEERCLRIITRQYYEVAPCPTTRLGALSFLYKFVSDTFKYKECESFNETCTFGPGWMQPTMQPRTRNPGSGPSPSARYLQGVDIGLLKLGIFNVEIDQIKNLSGAGGRIVAADKTGIPDDNMVGNWSYGGEFCLDAVPLGMLEVWAVELVDGKVAVALVNRSPGADTIVATRKQIAAAAPMTAQHYTVTDVWSGDVIGTFSEEWPMNVEAFDVGYLLLTPKK